MAKLILPVSMIIMCIIGLFVMIVRMKRSGNSEKKKQEAVSSVITKTVQEFINVKDILDIFLYTMDGYLISYVKIQPISIDLLSLNEKKVLAKKLTDEFSEFDDPFKFLAVSRPVDITPLVNEYAEMISNSSNPIQKEILRNEIRVISEFSLSGEVVQREFYYMIWERENESAESDLRKRTNELLDKLDGAGLKSEILKQHEITRLCNLVNNPAYATIEDTNINAVIPYLE
jgi:hypothetical protein